MENKNNESLDTCTFPSTNKTVNNKQPTKEQQTMTERHSSIPDDWKAHQAILCVAS